MTLQVQVHHETIHSTNRDAACGGTRKRASRPPSIAIDDALGSIGLVADYHHVDDVLGLRDQLHSMLR